ncbi:TetR/AcrR family transcriptional regulator [Lactococcus kimchii]|uniref:TetR/AcrR family transcriptional regulator n=1 Tax=Lactococcus sp. S-13 TaxID=2507158 RepID=UPI001023CBF0|nr:TetR/AcrR family transcriptional regulator [Lactococcus sp. S-13]RZI48712.1 TetR/AcrR family transcriptional regulator [Lactococcus sp. S-13]
MARAKEFDYDEVLEKATELFLEKGYDNTSFQDLVNHLGIHRRSIYDTYGDKQELYLKVMEKYARFINQNYFSMINDEMSVKEKFEAIFNYSAFPTKACPKGCLFVNSAIELALRNNEISNQVQLFFDNTKNFFVDLLTMAKEKEEIAQETDVFELASYLNNALIGIRVLVKCSPNKSELTNIIKTTLSIL